MTMIIGGFVEPPFAILDLADESRRVFGLSCGPDTSELRTDTAATGREE
jgi:hypothetical protein